MPVDAVALSNAANIATLLQTGFKIGSIGSKFAHYVASAAKESDLVIASRNLDTALDFLMDLKDSDMDSSDANVLLRLAIRHQELSMKCEKMCEGLVRAPKSTWKRWIPFIAVDHNPAVDSEQWARVCEQTRTLRKSAKAFSDRRKQMEVIAFSRQKGAVIDDDSRSIHSTVSAWTHVSHPDTGDVVVYPIPQPSENIVPGTEANVCQPTTSTTIPIITDTTLEHDIVIYHNFWDQSI